MNVGNQYIKMKTDKDIFDKFEYFISLIENPKLQRVKEFGSAEGKKIAS